MAIPILTNAMGRVTGDVLASESDRALVGASRPTISLSRVLLPAPFGADDGENFTIVGLHRSRR